MADRTIQLSVDHTTPTFTVDLAPQAFDMELSFAEIDVFQHDNVTLNFIVTQNGIAFPLSGYTVLYQAKTAVGDASYIFNKTATITDAANGKCSVALTPSDLAASGTLQTQLYLTQTGLTQTVFQCPMVVNSSV